MKKILFIIGLIASVGILGCSSVKTTDKTADQKMPAKSEKTIGQQLDEAETTLKDCYKNCEDAPTPALKEQCRQACGFAKKMHKAARKATKPVADKTPTQIEEDFKKGIIGGMNQEQRNQIKALEDEPTLLHEETEESNGARVEPETDPANLPPR